MYLNCSVSVTSSDICSLLTLGLKCVKIIEWIIFGCSRRPVLFVSLHDMQMKHWWQNLHLLLSM